MNNRLPFFISSEKNDSDFMDGVEKYINNCIFTTTMEDLNGR